MKRGFIAVLATVLSFAGVVVAQSAPASANIIDKTSPSVALVLAAGPDRPVTFGTAVVVRPDGVLLTAYHVVRGAREVQVRTKDGETYDQVQLLAFDERRDIAALRISATGLPAVTPAKLATAVAGRKVFVISHPLTLAWTTSVGVVSAVRPVDEIPGAGSGYRVVQFTAPVSSGSSGGLLLDEDGAGIGLVVASLRNAQNMNFAVPLESVLGLANATGGTAFASGKNLKLPAENAREVAANEEPARSPAANPTEAESSDILSTRDPQVMLQKFRTLYVSSKTVWLKEDVIQAALSRQPEFMAWKIVVVSDPKVADLRLTVNRVLFTWDWTYELTHRNTGMVLHTGKITSIEGRTAATDIAQHLVGLIKTVRPLPAQEQKPAGGKSK